MLLQSSYLTSWVVSAAVLIFSQHAFGEGQAIFPAGGGQVSIPSQRFEGARAVNSDWVSFIVNFQCIGGVNLRYYGNPLWAGHSVLARGYFQNEATPVQIRLGVSTFWTWGAGTDIQVISAPAGYQFGYSRSWWNVSAVVSFPKITAIGTINPAGQFDEINFTYYGTSATHARYGAEWWGIDGYAYPTANHNRSYSMVSVVVPQEGYCGNYRSPLMLFTDNRLPTFDNKTEFQIDPTIKNIYWVEPNAPGYFLAYDKNKNGRIDDGNELFGSAQEKNGFIALAKYDSNHDRVIDEKDKIWTKLTLWKDRNGDGKTDPGELLPLSTIGLKSVSLKYKAYPDYAPQAKGELRQHAKFTFTDNKTGKEKKGEVIDVWFSPDPAVYASTDSSKMYGPGY